MGRSASWFKIGGVWGAQDGWARPVFKTEPTWFLGRLVLPDVHMGGYVFFLTKMVGHPEGRLTLRCEHIDLRLQTESANWRTDVDQMIKGSTHPGLQRKVVPFKTNDASIKCVCHLDLSKFGRPKNHIGSIHETQIHFGPQEVLLCSTASKYLCFSASSLGVSMAFCSWEIPKKILPQTHTSDGRSWFTYTWSSGNFWIPGSISKISTNMESTV